MEGQHAGGLPRDPQPGLAGIGEALQRAFTGDAFVDKIKAATAAETERAEREADRQERMASSTCARINKIGDAQATMWAALALTAAVAAVCAIILMLTFTFRGVL